MWKLSSDNYSPMRAERFLEGLYPNESHGVGGDCRNPKCGYIFSPEDEKEMYYNGGWITCPNCGTIQNPMEEGVTRKTTKAGITPSEMGNIGEEIVGRLHTIPLLGEITWKSNQVQFPIDMIAGPFGVEIKTNHSEAQPRFKLGGGTDTGRSGTLKGKLMYCENNNLRPALVGVRLNFYTDKADIFVRPDSFTDTWIGANALHHVASVDFTDLNPFKRPEDVPPPSELPEDSDIPY
jgi:hypothetical protein